MILSSSTTPNIFAKHGQMELKNCKWTTSRYYCILMPFLWWKVMRKKKLNNSIRVCHHWHFITHFCRVEFEFKPFWTVTRCDWCKWNSRSTTCFVGKPAPPDNYRTSANTYWKKKNLPFFLYVPSICLGVRDCLPHHTSDLGFLGLA